MWVWVWVGVGVAAAFACNQHQVLCPDLISQGAHHLGVRHICFRFAHNLTPMF